MQGYTYDFGMLFIR